MTDETKSSRWDVVRRAFADIDEAPDDERAGRLAALAPDIRAEVESLRAAAHAAPHVLNLRDAPPEFAGMTIGPYRVLAELGRGGMGVVYRAERVDGEFSRTVAVKLAAGRLFAPEADRRFIQERQILAQLDHPNIVRLLDGGVTRGQRYLVMELAEGEPITAYARSHELSRVARLHLFRAVCAAIHYAHLRLVLHRDLKAGNIIVTSEGVVKVLDFGIAQLMRGDDSEAVAAGTDTVLHPFSLSCASPEQVRGERLSLASDIYALGVLLYELVAGVNPQQPAGATLDDVHRRIVETTPAPPTEISGARARDLDAIVLKALAKEPRHRYASVAELDADVERFIDGRPVLAVAPSALYVASRFVRRNKALTATAVALLALLVTGAGIYVRQARIERRRFEDARRLVHSVIFDIQPKLDGVAGALPLRKTLIEETMTYLESVSKDAGSDVGLLRELSSAYRELARVQGDLTTSSLGAQATAADRYARADALMGRALAAAPSDPAVLKDAALLYSRLAAFESTQGHPDVALTLAKRAMAFAERNLQARGATDFDAREILAGTTFYLGVTAPAGEWDYSVRMFTRTMDLFAALAAEQPAKEALRRNLAGALRFLASLHADKGRLAEAVAFGRRASAASDATLAGRPTDIALQLDAATDAGLLATYLDSSGDTAGAAALFERALALEDAILLKDAANARAALFRADAARGYARNRLNAGDRSAARLHITRALEMFATLVRDGKLPQGTRWRIASATVVLADLDKADGLVADACTHYREAIEAFDAAAKASPLSDGLAKEADDARRAAAGCRQD